MPKSHELAQITCANLHVVPTVKDCYVWKMYTRIYFFFSYELFIYMQKYIRRFSSCACEHNMTYHITCALFYRDPP